MFDSSLLTRLSNNYTSSYQIDPSAVKPGAATTSEGVLANFFNSLLSKKTGGLAGGQPGPVGAAPSVGPGAAGTKPAVGADDCEYFSAEREGRV